MMTKPLLTLTLLMGIRSTTALAQPIQNPSFEIPRDTNHALPAGWGLTNPKTGYTVVLDSTVSKSGRRSVKITSVPNAAVPSGGFGQSCTVVVGGLMIAHLRSFVKTDNPSGVGVWWNAWQDETHRGFVNSDQQVHLRYTDDWQLIDLVMPVQANINRFNFGAFLDGKGQAWFDDVQFELVSPGTGEPSAEVKAYVQRVISVVKKHALVRDSIPWPQTEAELMIYAGGMQRVEEVYPVINHLLNVMRKYGDNHSFFLSPSGVKNQEASEIDNKGRQPQVRYLGDGVGYVAVPGFLGIKEPQKTAFARQIQRLIQGIDTAQTVAGWVVDLRGNEGGNMTPMIAGLGPLLGEGTLGYFVDGKREVAWGYRNGKFYIKKPGKGTTVPNPYRLRQAGARVAVLIGPRTGSSGEMTAISFIGRPNTRLFGLPSGGYTTANEDFKLPNKTLLFLATATSADRTHKKYPQRITPDEEIKAPTTATTDPTLDAAKAWLLKR